MGDELRAKLPKYQEQLARHRFLAQQKATGSGRSNHEGDRWKEEIRGKKRDDRGDGSGTAGSASCPLFHLTAGYVNIT